MLKMKALSTKDDSYDKVQRRVTVVRDNDPESPMEWSQFFEVWANHPDLCGSKGAEDPMEEVFNESLPNGGGWVRKPRDGYVVIPVTALIHSGVYLSLGSSFSCDPGGWDTSRGALLLYTSKEIFERTAGSGMWKNVYDKESKKWRPAKDEAEWGEYLHGIAEDYVQELNLWNSGTCFGYTEEYKTPVRPYHCVKTFKDGKVEEFAGEDGGEWRDGDSCYGFLTDRLDDIDFLRDPEVPVFCEPDTFLAGKEYSIPEFLIRIPKEDGGENSWCYLEKYEAHPAGGWEARTVDYKWCGKPKDALIFHSWWKSQQVAQDVIPKDKYDAMLNIVEKDSLKPEEPGESRESK